MGTIWWMLSIFSGLLGVILKYIKVFLNIEEFNQENLLSPAFVIYFPILKYLARIQL